MRTELLELAQYYEPIVPYEIQATVELCAGLAQSHWSATHRDFEHANLDDHPTIEALADRNFATAYEVQFVWQFGLWRLQALFESILSHRFPETASFRIGRKLSCLRQQGLLSESDCTELFRWIELRNLLSHRPPHAPTLVHQIERQDLEEFAAFLTRVLEPVTTRQTSGVNAT